MDDQSRGAESIHDFLRFRKLVTPYVIEVLFWLEVLAFLVGGVLFIVGASAEYGSGTAQIVEGVFMILLGPVFARISCELIMVLFGIHRTLGEIRDTMRCPGGNATQLPAAFPAETSKGA